MTCVRAEKYLVALVDGELHSTWRKRALCRHLHQCAACRQSLLVQLRIKSMLHASIQREKVPATLQYAIQKRLAEEMN
ncbi:MAG: hypothetical protein H6695_00405 [Deferribacteres bacterium]|nr:hypothetical protein [candidate division KSB1 bacterium]MCB9508610.1 hypothetical protein [Deferribacteres bacterium]